MSTHVQLNANKRNVVGNSVRILRRNGLTPAVIYSKTYPSTPLELHSNEFMKIYKIAGKNSVIDLNIDGKIETCIIHKIDTHPFKPIIRHVDFLLVDMKKEVESEVPVILVGVSPAVKESGAILNQVLNTLTVKALPDLIPKSIEISIESLVEYGDIISIENLPANENYSFVDDGDTLIVSLTSETVDAPETNTVVEEAPATPATPAKK